MTTTSRPERPIIEKTLRNAEAADAKASEELTNARAQLAHAREKLDENKTTASRQAVVNAKEDLESAERVHAKTSDALERARINLAQLEHAELLERYEAAKSRVLALGPELEAHAATLVALDKQQITTSIEAIARSVGAAGNAYIEAERLANDLRMTPDLDRVIKRPDIAEARLFMQTALGKARAADERLDLSEWICSPPGDWRLKGMSAAERRQIAEYVARNQSEAEQVGRAILEGAVKHITQPKEGVAQ